jgi:hypothetical protein
MLILFSFEKNQETAGQDHFIIEQNVTKSYLLCTNPQIQPGCYQQVDLYSCQ